MFTRCGYVGSIEWILWAGPLPMTKPMMSCTWTSTPPDIHSGFIHPGTRMEDPVVQSVFQLLPQASRESDIEVISI